MELQVQYLEAQIFLHAQVYSLELILSATSLKDLFQYLRIEFVGKFNVALYSVHDVVSWVVMW